MADTIRYGTTPDIDGKDRVFNTKNELPDATSFGPGIAFIKEGPTIKISDGTVWRNASPEVLDSVSAIPAEQGVYQVGSQIYIVGVNGNRKM